MATNANQSNDEREGSVKEAAEKVGFHDEGVPGKLYTLYTDRHTYAYNDVCLYQECEDLLYYSPFPDAKELGQPSAGPSYMPRNIKGKGSAALRGATLESNAERERISVRGYPD